MGRLYYLLNVAQHTVSTHANRQCIDILGITAAQLAALFVLAKHPNLRQSELANELACTKGAITTLTERLCSAALVHKTPCSEDRRATRLALTEKGRNCLNQGEPLVANFQKELTSGLNEAEVATIMRFLQHAIGSFR